MKVLRQEVINCILSSGGMLQLMDMHFLPLFNVTDEEMDFITGIATGEELNLMIDLKTFSSKRKALEIRNKYLKQFNEQ